MSTNTSASSLSAAYLALVEFLLLSKRQIVSCGLGHDLNAPQTMMIFLLDRPRPMRDFTTIFHCDPSNITGIVDGLEDKKLVERIESPIDRRIKVIQLKPKGSRIRAHLLDHLTGSNSHLLANLSTTEINTFINLVHKITN